MSIPEPVGRQSPRSSDPHLAAAREFLLSAVKSVRERGLVRLAPIKKLAAAAGVSHAVMSAAVAELRRSGAVTTAPRRGILVAGPTPRPVELPPLPEPSRWRHLRRELWHSITSGQFGAEALPARKELMRRYGVSRKTLNRALRALAGEGALAPAGRTFRPALPMSRPRLDTLVLFARGSEAGQPLFLQPHSHLLFAALERICHARNVKLTVLPCTYRGETRDVLIGGADGLSPRRAFDPARTLGFMIWQLGLHAAYTGALARRLQEHRKPVALFAEDPADPEQPILPRSRLIRRYAVTPGFDAGLAVGRYLLALGHRTLCCWSDQAGLPWVRERIAGISRSFEERGLPPRCTLIAPAADQTAGGPCDRDRAIARLTPALAETAAALGVEPRRTHLSDVALSVYYGLIYREHVYRQLLPLMEQAARSGDATVWIGLNDAIANECLSFLHERGIAVPESVSVMGFDDSLDAAAHRLTSYNFNGEEAMHRMVNFLLSPHAPVSMAEAGKPTVAQGFVHERATTGPAPARRA